MARFGTYSENTSPADADLLVSVDVSDTTDDATGSTKRLSLSGLRTFFGAIFAPLASPTFTGTTTTSTLTATGAVTLSATLPNLKFYETDGVADERLYQIVVNNNSFVVRQSTDAAVNVSELIRYVRTTKELRLTDNTSVTLPVPTTTGDALRWGSDATVAALTATGDVTVSSNNPILEMYDTNGTADQRRWRFQVVADDVRVRLMSDDGLSVVATPIRLEDDSIVFAENGQSVNVSGASFVSLPVPSATGHALRWDSDATVAALTATDGILSSGSTGTSVPAAEGLEVINTNATSGEQRVKLSVTSSGGPRLDIMSDDGSSQLRNAFIARPDGEFRLTGNTSVSVPVPTTTGHALRWSSAANVASLELNAGGLTGLGDVVEEVSTANVTGAYTLVDGFGIYDLTMTADSTLTFPTAPASGDGTSFLLILRGAFTPTLPATVDWAGGTPPAYVAALSMYAFTTVDGGAMWLGVQAGAGFA